MQRQQFAQKAFICKGELILAVQKSDQDPHNPGRWEMPGGRMDFGEDVDEHLIREVREETGITVIPGNPFHIWQWVMSDIKSGSDDQIQVIAVARECRASGEQAETALEDTDFISGHAWLPIADLLDFDLIPSLRPVAEAFLANRGNS